MRRVSVVGNSGSGKSRLARRIADLLDAPLVELDSIHHLPGWRPIDPELFMAEVARHAAGEAWVIDGNYRRVVLEGPVWQRADTVVWLDPPRRIVLRQVVGRTLRRVLTRQELWNGNREPFANLWRWEPERSIIRWSWTKHDELQERYTTAMASPAFDHLTFVHLRSHAEAEEWLAGLERPTNATPEG